MNPEEKISKIMEQGGGAMAFIAGMFQWMGDNHSAIASTGIVFGMFIGAAGFFLSWYYKRVYKKILIGQGRDPKTLNNIE
jgi:hypothetical protein